MIKVRHKGNFYKTIKYMGRLKKAVDPKMFDKYGREGVAALASTTPVKTGLTANSWYYRVTSNANQITLEFLNSNIQNGVPIAIILFYGHGTRNGGWVEGYDYINPAIQPIFNKITEEMWREVSRL